MSPRAMGYVDLHNHLLWDIDDGCETPAETLEAARLLVALGFSDVAASPHAIPELPSGDAEFTARRRAEAAALFAREGVPLALHANAENRLDDEFLARADGPGRRGIGETQRWALVEAPFQSGVPALADLVFLLRRKGISPLFAHPERCLEFERPGRAEEVVRLGGSLQLNLGALVGLYGKGAKRLAERFLGDDLYAVAATDLHQPAGALRWIGDALEALEKRAGKAALEKLCEESPRRILAGEELA
jgi:protein-tyrosine phosphatase